MSGGLQSGVVCRATLNTTLSTPRKPELLQKAEPSMLCRMITSSYMQLTIVTSQTVPSYSAPA